MTADPFAALRAANPLPDETARNVALPDVELIALIEAEASEANGSISTHPVASQRRPIARLGLVGALAAAAVAVIAVLPSGRSSSGPAAPEGAWAAELVQFAEASPLLLLDAPGWRVTYADERGTNDGEMQFVKGSAPLPKAVIETSRRTAYLHWRPGSLAQWAADRSMSAARSTTAPVLGTRAQVYEYRAAGDVARLRDYHDVTALWRYEGRVLEFRWAAPNMDTFKAILARLRRVDTNAWLSAIPPSVIKAADRPTTIAAMLRGIPLPPGFGPESIRGSGLSKDRYQVGAQVVGTVACTWIARWSDARRRGDRATTQAAIAAMATAKDWPILREMAKTGAYPSVLRDFAAAMRTGDWHGRPLEGDVNQVLGCAEFGVRLGQPLMTQSAP